MWIIDKILGRTSPARARGKSAERVDIPERDRAALLRETESRSFDMAETRKPPMQ
jgi:hypothetical protein